MSKKVTTILCSVTAIVVCAAVIVITLLYLRKSGDGISHLQAGGMDLTLPRENLFTRGPNEQGKYEDRNDNNAADFTDANMQNIFGITGETVILPGCAFSAEMVIACKSEKADPFAYWLGIELNGELNELAKQLKITVTVDGGEPISCYLSENLTIGSESEPLARVTDAVSSAFNVRIEFDRNITGGGNAQDEWAVFDLIVYAVKI